MGREREEESGKYGILIGIRPSRKRVTENGDRKRLPSVLSVSRQSQCFIEIYSANLKTNNEQLKIEQKVIVYDYDFGYSPLFY